VKIVLISKIKLSEIEFFISMELMLINLGLLY
jgi:hypothetical protein